MITMAVGLFLFLMVLPALIVVYAIQLPVKRPKN